MPLVVPRVLDLLTLLPQFAFLFSSARFTGLPGLVFCVQHMPATAVFTAAFLHCTARSLYLHQLVSFTS